MTPDLLEPGPTTSVAIPTLTAIQRRTILEQWSGPAHDPSLSAPGLLHQFFEDAADDQPGAVALQCGGETLTYAELEGRANQLAHELRAAGVGAGSAVAILLPRSSAVFVAMLGILKAGGAYVPLDGEYPAERVGHILGDSRARVLITTRELAGRHKAFGGQTLFMDSFAASGRPTSRLAPAATAESTAYIIYTSGSTGQPKGVPILHSAVCNLVRAEARIFNIHPTDRVYQGFSVAFDASVEEIWLAFYAGATLFAATAEMVHAGPALSRILTEQRITVLSCVPTLLSILDAGIPTLRLLILGGEASTAHLIGRWSRPGLRIVNTYGPTEATVIATYGDCVAGAAVTIGRPVPNYRVYILDPETLGLLPPGTPGELCISGPGLSPGYLFRAELTGEKFRPNPFCAATPYDRLYRTGDLAQWTAEGEIEFLGRLDSQVKIRGFRVELSEIESALMDQPGVLAAAVAVHQSAAGVQQLVAYVVARDGGAGVDVGGVKMQLRARLPQYMVPAIFEILERLPTLPSGKVDRKALPRPLVGRAEEVVETPGEGPRNALEEAIAGAWEGLFGAAVSRTADFFMDLGGHSLLAAKFVSDLRGVPDFAALSVLDVYNHPTVEKLAAEMVLRHVAGGAASAVRAGVSGEGAASAMARGASRMSLAARHRVCGLAQFLTLYFIIGFYAIQWITPYLTYTLLQEEDVPYLASIAISLGTIVALLPAMLLFSIVAKWVLLGRLKPGRYPVWGFFYFRWWLTQRFLAAMPVDYLVGTPLATMYFRALGVKIGRNVYLGTDQIGAFDLVSIGDDSSIGIHSALLGYTIENGYMHLGPISVGRNCFVGSSASLRPNSAMEDSTHLGDLSLLPAGVTIPTGQTWLGSPAKRVANAPPIAPPPPRPDGAVRLNFIVLHAIGVLAIPVVYLAALFPGLVILNEASGQFGPIISLAFSPLAALVLIVVLAAEIIVVKWLLLGRVKAGVYPLNSFFYLRKWFVDQLMDLSLDILGPMYATLYLNPWYRALGAKLGPLAEISTACAASPDLLAIGAESFVADAVSLGVPHVNHGQMTLAQTTIGYRAFIGNSSLIPAGTRVGDNTLIGVLTLPPVTRAPRLASDSTGERAFSAATPDTTWLGSPAIYLPQRQQATAFSAASTFRPTQILFAQRLAIEFVRIVLPLSLFIFLASSVISSLVYLQDELELWFCLLLFPLLYAGAGLASAIMVIAAKWLLIGRYVPQERPLWCPFVWRSELLNALHENLAQSFFTDMLMGTPFLGIFFRALGMKIGRRVLLDSAEFTEFDLVTLGDDVVLNSESTIQTHLFEDRVMKMSTIQIGAKAAVGANSVVLYDSVIARGAVLEDLSLVMKGESLPAGTRWHGTPASLARG